jgi:hypothetical protein
MLRLSVRTCGDLHALKVEHTGNFSLKLPFAHVVAHATCHGRPKQIAFGVLGNTHVSVQDFTT